MIRLIKVSTVFMIFLMCMVTSVATTVVMNLYVRDTYIERVIDGYIENNVQTILTLNKIVKASQVAAVDRVTVTAYSPRVIETDSTPFINACGKRVAEGQVAVSRDLWNAGYQCGSRILIEGKGEYIVMDKMNKRWKNRVDIFFMKTRHAYRFGKKSLIVRLLTT